MAAKQAKQYRLFEDEPKEGSTNKKQITKESPILNELLVTKEDSKKESKLKHLISSRLKKIEKLKSLLQKDKDNLNNIKDLYQKHLSKDDHELSRHVEKLVEKLIQRYGQKSFSRSQRDLLEYLIEKHFDKLMLKEYSSETLNGLIETYNELKESYYAFDEGEYDDDEEFGDELNDFEKEFADSFGKELIQNMLEDMGLNVGAEFFEDLNPSDSDFQSKFKERIFEFAEQHQTDQKSEEKRQKTLTTDKEFTKLYKSLVKKVHPDLARDVEEKNRREELMKELSTVWENRDYYQLLILQSKIDPDSNNGFELNDSQLELIANDLLENTRELEQERYTLKKHPENEFYFSKFYARSDKKIIEHLNNYKKHIENEKKQIAENIQHLKTQKTTKEFLKSVDEEISLNDFFDFI